jgi:hypothetical protein
MVNKQEVTNMTRRDSVALLPATQCLFNARTINLGRLNEVWNTNCVYVLRNCDTEKLVFAASCGRLWNSAKFAVGTQHSVHHDQTQAFRGVFRIENIIDIKDGEIVKAENDVGVASKAPLWVFK